jgi:PAS domain S-box-containing protein
LPFILAVIVAARFGGRGPGLAATALSALAVLWFLVEPYYSLTIVSPGSATGLALFVISSSLMSFLIGDLRTSFRLIAQAEETLRRQAQLINLSHDAIISTDSDRRILTWNAGAQEIYGWTEREAVGKETHSFLQTSCGLSTVEIDEILDREGQWNGELYHIGRDGRRVAVDSRHVLVRDEENLPADILEINRDITVRKKMEDVLRESETRFRALVTASSEVLYRMSPDWSEMRQLSGGTFIADTEAPNRNWLEEYIPADEQPRVTAVINEAIRTESIFALEHRVRRVDGSVGWTFSRAIPMLDANGKIIEWFGAASDITQRKQAEQDLRESEERFRTLADNISQFAWMADAEGWIFWYNRRWYEYTRTTLEEMQGWGWQSVSHPDHVERVVLRIKRSFETGEPWEDTFPLRGKDGQYRWFLSRALPIRDAEGRIVRWFGTNTDITRQLETEEQLRNSEQRYRRCSSQCERVSLCAKWFPTLAENPQTGDTWTSTLPLKRCLGGSAANWSAGRSGKCSRLHPGNIGFRLLATWR